MFFSDDVLSAVAGWYSVDDCTNMDGATPRYQSAKVAVWATFSNEEARLNITADVTTFVHNVSSRNTYNITSIRIHTTILYFSILVHLQ